MRGENLYGGHPLFGKWCSQVFFDNKNLFCKNECLLFNKPMNWNCWVLKLLVEKNPVYLGNTA